MSYILVEDIWKEHIIPQLSIYQIRRLALVDKELNKVTQPIVDEKFKERIIYCILVNKNNYHISKINKVSINFEYNEGYSWYLGPNDIWKDDRKEFYNNWIEYNRDMKIDYGKGNYYTCRICKNDKLIKKSSIKKHRQSKGHIKKLESYDLKRKEEKYLKYIHKIQTRKNTLGITLNGELLEPCEKKYFFRESKYHIHM